MNGFHKDYILHFIKGANAICSEERQKVLKGIVLGRYERSPFSFDTINKVLSLWVQGIDRLIVLSLSAGDKPNSARIAKLYEQRGIHYEEFYYLVNDQVPQEEYTKTPAFIFTKVFSKDQRKRKFGHLSFREEDFLDFILPLDIVPSIYLSIKRETIIPIDSLFAHSYCVAKTRSGKTETLKLIVHGLIQKRDQKTSLLILDPHGEFAREVRRFKILQEQRDNFIYIDPSIDSDYTPVFNPFEIPPSNTSDLVYKSDSILDAFQQLLKDQIISGNMKRLLRHCINALLYMPDTSMMDLLTLLMAINRNRTLKVPEFFPREAQLMEFGRLAPDPLTRKFFEFGYRDVDARTIGAVIERVDGILSHPLVRKFVIGKNSFDLGKYLNEGKIVVINLDFTKMGNIGSEAIGRLLVSEAQNISAQRNILPKQGRPRTIIFMDECQRFVSAAIERALSEFAKFNTYLFLAHQYIEQIDDAANDITVSIVRQLRCRKKLCRIYGFYFCRCWSFKGHLNEHQKVPILCKVIRSGCLHF